MLYLSRLLLDTHNRLVQRDLGNCHRLHQRVLSAFPDVSQAIRAREHFGLLYRAETVEHEPGLVRLLVQSASAPAWERLPGTYLADPPDERGNPAVRLIDQEYNQIQAGMRFIFRLRANPTKRIGKNNLEQEAKWRGKRIELRQEAEQLAWLERKGTQGGFRLMRVVVRPELSETRVTTLEKTRGHRPQTQTAPARTLTFGAALFEGWLEVTDRAQFLTTLRGGIGSGKAFGFGLLSIASAR